LAERTDYYAVLGVERGASLPAIKAAYRRLASAHHPDRHPSDENATQRFQALVAAYSVLGDPTRRASYDAGRHVVAMRVEPGAPWAELFGRVLDQLFGVVDRVAAPGSDTRYRLSLGYAEAALGCSRTLSLPAQDRCGGCDGRGFDLTELPSFCERCASLGTLERRPGLRGERVPCPDCDGRGYSVDHPCPDCEGSGMIGGRHEMKIQVPARAKDGQRLLVRAAGAAGRHGGTAGDCFVELQVAAHPHLTARGDDLWIDRPIPLPRALAGGWIQVPSLGGSARIRVPAGSVDGDVLRMEGYGLPRPGGDRGDQLVTLAVEMPESLSEGEAHRLSLLLDEAMERFPRSALFEAAIAEDEGAP
jgi:molecular chaperone DnaJ